VTGLHNHFTLPRNDLKVVEMGATINARMGLNTWAAFTGTNEKAAIAEGWGHGRRRTQESSRPRPCHESWLVLPRRLRLLW
jgi:hypothetical protein